MMKKIIILFLALVILGTGCQRATATAEDIQGVNLFDRDTDYETYFVPETSIAVSDLIPEFNSANMALICSDGSTVYPMSDGVIRETSAIGVSFETATMQVDDVVSIYMGQNRYSITDTYRDAKQILEDNGRVMIVLLDGFGNYAYKRALESGQIPYLSTLEEHEALSVYVPVTNAGFAAMITGQGPDVNGVHDRSYRDLKVQSIFGDALEMGKKSILIEADIQILNTEIAPELHVDVNGDGNIDDEIFEQAKEVAGEDYDLIFIHFHGIDDRGHDFGPDAEETMAYVKVIDGYVETLASLWDGNMILTADHGMDFDEEGGYHGRGNTMDMVVPYFTRECVGQ